MIDNEILRNKIADMVRDGKNIILPTFVIEKKDYTNTIYYSTNDREKLSTWINECLLYIRHISEDSSGVKDQFIKRYKDFMNNIDEITKDKVIDIIGQLQAIEKYLEVII